MGYPAPDTPPYKPLPDHVPTTRTRGGVGVGTGGDTLKDGGGGAVLGSHKPPGQRSQDRRQGAISNTCINPRTCLPGDQRSRTSAGCGWWGIVGRGLTFENTWLQISAARCRGFLKVGIQSGSERTKTERTSQ